MTIRCSICKLPADKRSAIDAALGADVSLVEVSTSSGISKSALQRHSKHLTPATAVTTAIPKPRIAIADAVVAEPVSELKSKPTGTCSKAQLLERIELLWTESIEGLEASKELVTITKPDGNSVQLPGDLRARAAFIREGRNVLAL